MKKIHIYIAIGLLSATSYSCKKDLNAPPSQALVADNVVIDQKSSENVLNGAYARFVNATSGSSITHRWATYHEVPPAEWAGWVQNAFGADQNQQNSNTPSSSATWWPTAYNILNAANGVVAGVSALDDSKFNPVSRKTEILAEARFLRAYAHWMLLAYFSEWYKPASAYGVLLRKEPLSLSNSNYPRSSVQESYDYILQDLDYAIANASDTRPNYYVNKTAAKALKMRVLMMHGQAADYTSVNTIAADIIANPIYALEPNLKDLFQVKGLTSKEVILGITPYPSQITKSSTYTFVQSSVFLATSQFKNLFAAGDPRSTWMYGIVGTANATMVSQGKKDSLYLTKYNGPKTEESYAFRLTEVYLLKAEALLRSGAALTEPKAILKNIEGHAGVTNFAPIDNAVTADDLLMEIYKETARNMVAEDGIEWLNLLRFPFNTIKQLRPTITDPRQLILPIPTTELQLNFSIGPQNPGY